MRILIISTQRSGSTYLGRTLSDRYGLTYLHEPELMSSLVTSLDTLNNFCMKVVITQLYHYNQINQNLSIDECTEYFYSILSQYVFDKILILDRRNEIEHIEATINLDRARNNKDGFVEWVYDEKFINSITSEEWNHWKIYTLKSKKWLNCISEKFNIPIVYYEDVYYDTNNVDLQGLEFNPDLSRKLRRNIKPSLI